MGEVLRITSGIWSLIHTVFMFIIITVHKFSSKKSVAILCATVLPLIIFNILIFLYLGQEEYGQNIIFAFTIPFLLISYIIAKYHSFKFIITFCLVNTMSVGVIVLSIIFNFYFSPESNVMMFMFRFISFPMMEFALFKWLRRPYFEIQDSVKKGWGLFSLIAAAFLILLIIMSTYPSIIIRRPDDMPIMIVLLLLMPLLYFVIFKTLNRQKRLNEVEREKELWQIQATQMQREIHRMNNSEEQIKIARHDLRHRLLGIDALLQKGEIDEARDYIASSLKTLDLCTVKRYCQNVILDAIFSYYFKLAQDKEIRTEYDLIISDDLPVEVFELSVVVANALENAINACEQLPPDKRTIRCCCIENPQFMLQISNPYGGNIVVDEKGIPLDQSGRYGIGTRSILSFCEKHGAFVNYKIKNAVFSLRILVQKYPS